MWLYANKGFLSIVENFRNKEELLVRSRFDGDIESFFPEAEILVDVGTDYKYRTFLPREQVVEAVKHYMENELHYSNYKNSVKDSSRLSAYHKVWHNMYDAQEDRARRITT
jgi:hypothetical protein